MSNKCVQWRPDACSGFIIAFVELFVAGFPNGCSECVKGTNDAVDVSAAGIGFIVVCCRVDGCCMGPLLTENASDGVIPADVELVSYSLIDGVFEGWMEGRCELLDEDGCGGEPLGDSFVENGCCGMLRMFDGLLDGDE